MAVVNRNGIRYTEAGVGELIPQAIAVNDPDIVPVRGASGNVANAIAAATLAAAVGKTTYITGFTVTGAGATAGLPVLVTVTGTLGGTHTHVYAAVAGALLANTPLIVRFTMPIPASDVNTAIVVTVPALGTGNTHSTVVATGYQR